MTQTILAIFDDTHEALAAMRALQGAGLTQVEMLSGEPVHEAATEDESKSRIGLFAVLGAIIGASAALWLTVGTSRHVAINTGGMPLATPWAFGIIVFEMAMLSAILAALLCMIFEARLARPGAMKAYDEAVADDKIVLTVQCRDEESLQSAKDLLADTRAEVKGEEGSEGVGEEGSGVGEE
jgi:hypothetical protein